MRERQRTISKEASLAGPGFFSGETATVTFCPPSPIPASRSSASRMGKSRPFPRSVDNVLQPPAADLPAERHPVRRDRRALHGRPGRAWASTTPSSECPAARSANCPAAMAAAGLLSMPFRKRASSSRMQPLRPLIIRKPVQVAAEGRDACRPARPHRQARGDLRFRSANAPVGRQMVSFHLGDDDFAHQTRPRPHLCLRRRSQGSAGPRAGQAPDAKGPAGHLTRRADRQRISLCR